MNIEDPRAIGAQIRMRLPQLTPLELRVVDAITARKDLTEATPLKEIAQQSSVSEAMIVKIAKKLGFTGFREMRIGLVEYNQSDAANLYREISPDDSSASVIQKVFHTSMQALEETIAILDVEAFDRAADILHRATHRDFYGIGGSAQIARDVAHKFLRIGLRAAIYDDSHMMLMSASILKPDDAVVVFSHSGTTTAVLEATKLARKSGARTIAVTNYSDSPIAEAADVVLCSTAQGSPLLGENAAARIAQLNILDALFVAIAQRDFAAAERNLNKTMKAVSAKREK
ncbi:MurR/RpiR family transcriptional regulator [Pararhizobium sp. IMCC21322]|uniref:MurR/RpiR family transcriptional regulator n=1 Tax=Pararhizobium sp. IMCC21322 TaxID=3067903 RepID=UPI0027411CB1|nr:MurR/RpiR family transcriptional regulator [Pararhizobium sp. IMCC21322]